MNPRMVYRTIPILEMVHMLGIWWPQLEFRKMGHWKWLANRCNAKQAIKGKAIKAIEYMVTQKWCRANELTKIDVFLFTGLWWHHFGGFRILSRSVFHLEISPFFGAPLFCLTPEGKEAEEKRLKLCSIISLNGIFRNLNWRYKTYIRPIFQAM